MLLLLSLTIFFLAVLQVSSKDPQSTSPTCDLITIKSAGAIKDHANKLTTFIYYNSNNLLYLDQTELSTANELTISLSLPMECVILESYLEEVEKTAKNDKFDYEVGQSHHYSQHGEEEEDAIRKKSPLN